MMMIPSTLRSTTASLPRPPTRAPLDEASRRSRPLLLESAPCYSWRERLSELLIWRKPLFQSA